MRASNIVEWVPGMWEFNVCNVREGCGPCAGASPLVANDARAGFDFCKMAAAIDANPADMHAERGNPDDIPRNIKVVFLSAGSMDHDTTGCPNGFICFPCYDPSSRRHALSKTQKFKDLGSSIS
eukprot:1161615-Pelagomonas_calceolata.AAC.5